MVNYIEQVGFVDTLQPFQSRQVPLEHLAVLDLLHDLAQGELLKVGDPDLLDLTVAETL